MEFDFAAEEALAVTEEPVVRARLSQRKIDNELSRGDVESEAKRANRSAYPESSKVIRFPRLMASLSNYPSGHWHQQAEVPQPQEPLPRILETPGEEDATERALGAHYVPLPPARPAEQMELLPSFEDIRLEEGHTRAEIETEVVPHPAPLQQRFFAGLLDVIAVFCAAAVFGITFVSLAEDEPHSKMALLCGVAVGGVLWIVFQYLFLVHGEGTPGMRLAQLELSSFEGQAVSANARRCRALASALSALSIGLGYAWAFVDEDQLGWHDRITGTLLCSSDQPSSAGTEIWD